MQGLTTVSAEPQSLPISSSYDDIMVTARKEDVSSSPATGNVQIKTEIQNATTTNQSYEMDIDNLSKQVAQEAKVIPQGKSKKSMLNIIFKFALAMIWVIISSIVIFIILVSYKRLILKQAPAKPTYESLAQSLDTPKNFKEAIKIFLDKTKWQ